MEIQLTVNGIKETTSPMTVAEYIRSKGLEPTEVVVEHNGAILRQSARETAMLADSDVLEIVRFVTGG